MADQQENNSSYPIPALLLIVAIIAGGIFKFYVPLETLRPPLHEKDFGRPLGEEDVLARMWQDPFQAVETHVRNMKAQDEILKISQETKDLKVQDESFKVTKVLKYKNFEPGPYPEIHDIVILPVMVTAGRYGENIEERLRSRYAVLSALRVAGYISKDAEHIGYFERDIAGQPRTIPYEWFWRDPLPLNQPSPPRRTYDAVLILWLGDEYFSKERIAELKKLFAYVKDCIDKSVALEKACPEYTPKKYAQTIKVLGPANSTSFEQIIEESLPLDCSLYELLEEIYRYPTATDALSKIKSALDTAKNKVKKEIQDLRSHLNVEFEMYSPSATADPFLMLGKKPRKTSMLAKMYRAVKIDDILKEEDIFGLVLKYTGVAVQRSIHTDHQLTDELVEELSRRGVKIEDKSSGDIILISDWDTIYGRALPESFLISSILKEIKNKEENKRSFEINDVSSSFEKRVHIFNYMRSIDGMASNEGVNSHSLSKKSIDAGEKNRELL